MLYIIAGIFLASVLINYALIVLFTQEEVAELKNKMSFGSYVKELDEVVRDEIGDQGATILKICLVVVAVLWAIFSIKFLLLSLAAILLGTWASKKAYQVPAVANVVNKVATYINRLRK